MNATAGNAMSNAATGPTPDDDAQEAHLFLCLENGHYAATTDPSGANLPSARCSSGWKHIKAFSLGVREALPFTTNPEPVIRAIRDTGYYVHDSDLPHGTSQ
jgi:hypothetical protein